MLNETLVELAREVMRKKAEGQNVEVKAAHDGCPKRLYDSLSSFSNQDAGGVILFGLDERKRFEICGVYDAQDLLHKVTEQCNQMEPPVRAVFTTAVWDGLTICAAEIPGIDFSERPCYYKGAGRLEGAFIRVGDADLRMTEYELYHYEAFRKHIHDDERVVERASLEMMNSSLIEEYVRKKKLDRPLFAQMSESQAHEMLNLTRDGKPTLAAIMNFCIYPQGYFPQLAITAVVVPGTKIGDTDDNKARFIDNRRIEGTLSQMLEEAISFCFRNMKNSTIINPLNGKREDKSEYPLGAVREAILNALIHRDYSHLTEGTPIQIQMFSDRMEIHSPGGLYGRMTVEQLGVSHPTQRNPALAVMAETLLNAENRYSGIPTIMREMAEYHLPAPVFQNRRDEFVVIFYNQSASCAQTQDEFSSLLEFCKTPRTRQEIAAFLHLSVSSYLSNRYLTPLLTAGKLKLTIPDKPKSRNQRYHS